MSETIPYHLSIRITADGFSFTLEQEDGKVLLHRQADCLPADLPDRLRQEAHHQNLADKPFAHVQIILHTPLFQLVPNELYREEDRQKWLAFGHDKPLHRQCLYTDPHPAHNCQIVYCTDEVVGQTLRELFPHACYCHVLGDLLSEQSKYPTATCILAYQERRTLNAVVIKDHQLVLANRYAIQNDADAAYWLLNMAEQLALDIDVNSIHIQPEAATGLNNLLRDVMKP